MRITHLCASFMFGGPERQMLGLAEHSRHFSTQSFLGFRERGRALSFIREARERDFDAKILAADTPSLGDARRSLIRELMRLKTDLLLCHGYKSNLIGRLAARQLKIPAIAVCRGWTGESTRVKLYEAFDRRQIRKMDGVVCVSQELTKQVRRYGVSTSRLHTITNAVRPELFRTNRESSRERLLKVFRKISVDDFVIASAGRLSPEKGFDLIVDAAARIRHRYPNAKFVLFGEGNERESLQRGIAARGLTNDFFLPGFSDNLDSLLPGCDAFVSSSHTEGLPNVLLESAAMGLPIVATAVGGVPEVIRDGITGLLVPANSSELLAEGLLTLLNDESFARRLGRQAKVHVAEHFSFGAQAEGYAKLVGQLIGLPIFQRQAA